MKSKWIFYEISVKVNIKINLCIDLHKKTDCNHFENGQQELTSEQRQKSDSGGKETRLLSSSFRWMKHEEIKIMGASWCNRLVNMKLYNLK